jgi:hypothetical protein
MLLSMSKQFFTARLFTLIILDPCCIWASSPSEGISHLLFFQRIAKFRLTSPAMDGLPVGLSHLGFFVGTEGNLNKPALRGPAKVPPHLARKQPACSHFYLTGFSPISP